MGKFNCIVDTLVDTRSMSSNPAAKKKKRGTTFVELRRAIKTTVTGVPHCTPQERPPEVAGRAEPSAHFGGTARCKVSRMDGTQKNACDHFTRTDTRLRMVESHDFVPFRFVQNQRSPCRPNSISPGCEGLPNRKLITECARETLFWHSPFHRLSSMHSVSAALFHCSSCASTSAVASFTSWRLQYEYHTLYKA